MVAFITQATNEGQVNTGGENNRSIRLALFGGGGIGLLFGVIMGTSTTPTIATMLGVLTTLLAGILGLNDALFSNTKAARIGAFGLCCVLGAYLGLYVRSHNLLAPSLLELKRGYLAAGFSEQQAMRILAMKEFGMSLQSLQGIEPVKATVKATENAAENTAMPTSAHSDVQSDIQSDAPEPEREPFTESAAQSLFKQHNSLLFSAPVFLSGCDELAYTDASLPLEEVLNNFELTGGEWQKLATSALQNVPEAEQKTYLLTVKNGMCDWRNASEGQSDSAGAASHQSMQANLLQEGCQPVKQWLRQKMEQMGQMEGHTASANNSVDWQLLSAIGSEWATLGGQVAASGLTTRSAFQAFGQIHGLLCEEQH